jgi:hypothetical protein
MLFVKIFPRLYSPKTTAHTSRASLVSRNATLYKVFHSFIHSSMALLLAPGLFFSFAIIFTQTRLLGRAIIPSQARYLYTGQHKHRINAHRDIHVLSRIRTHDPSVRASEDSSCLRPRGHCDRAQSSLSMPNLELGYLIFHFSRHIET